MTSTVTVDLDAEAMPDFTPPPGPRFRIYDEVYEGAREISADVILDILAQLEKMEDSSYADQVTMIKDMMSVLLSSESAERFVANMASRTTPIGLSTIQTSMNWLIGKYTGRPTEPASDSSPGSENPESGTSSTATTSAEESTSSDSPQTDS